MYPRKKWSAADRFTFARLLIHVRARGRCWIDDGIGDSWCNGRQDVPTRDVIDIRFPGSTVTVAEQYSRVYSCTYTANSIAGDHRCIRNENKMRRKSKRRCVLRIGFVRWRFLNSQIRPRCSEWAQGWWHITLSSLRTAVVQEGYNLDVFYSLIFMITEWTPHWRLQTLRFVRRCALDLFKADVFCCDTDML